MSWILTVLRCPHPGYASFRIYFTVSIAIAAGVFFILSFLQPFNLGGRSIWSNPCFAALVYGGASYMTMLVNSFWLKLFPRFFSDEKWTLGKEMLMCVYQMISIATAIWLINSIREASPLNAHGYFGMLWIVVSVGFFPCLAVLLIRHIYLVKTRLRKATAMNINLMLDSKEAPGETDPRYIYLQSYHFLSKMRNN